jgi:hypothetical protein
MNQPHTLFVYERLPHETSSKYFLTEEAFE